MATIFSIPATLIFLFILSLLSFFFSASETAIIGLSKIRLRHMIAKGIKGAQSIQRLVNKLDRVITSILIGNNFVNIAMSAIVTGFFVQLFGYEWGIIIAMFTSAFIIVVLCEIIPKVISIKHTEKIAILFSPLMEIFIKLFHPVATIFIGISNFILKVLRLGPAKRAPLITEEELRLMIEVGKEEGVLSDEERKMLHRIFEFGDIRLSDVMVPKEKIIAVNIDATSDELLNTFVEKGHTRLPVYAGSIDNMVGIIYARDLLYILRDKGLFVLQDLIHIPYYAPASMRVNELLVKFQTDKIQIAIVIDERKKILGIVTLEDLIEEIVGEIEEAHPKSKLSHSLK